jgi:hypothetical protein
MGSSKFYIFQTLVVLVLGICIVQARLPDCTSIFRMEANDFISLNCMKLMLNSLFAGEP